VNCGYARLRRLKIACPTAPPKASTANIPGRSHHAQDGNKIFASGQAIPDAEHRGITPDLTRLASEPDAKIEEAKDIKPTQRVGVLNPME